MWKFFQNLFGFGHQGVEQKKQPPIEQKRQKEPPNLNKSLEKTPKLPLKSSTRALLQRSTPEKASKAGSTTSKVPTESSKVSPTASKVPNESAKVGSTASKLPDGSSKVSSKASKLPEKTAKIPLKSSTKALVQKAKNWTPNTSSPVSIEKLTKSFAQRLNPQNTCAKGELVYDVCCYVIHCVKHNKICLSANPDNSFIWLPFIAITGSQTWTDSSHEGVYIILSNGDPTIKSKLKERSVVSSAQCMQIFRLQLPQTQKFNTRLIYYIKLIENQTVIKCCEDSPTIKWYDREDIINNKIKNLWGPEVIEYCKLSGDSVTQKIEEYSLDQAFFYVPRDPPRNQEEELLRSTNYTEKDVERIYGDFVEHCFPSFYMTNESFIDYMVKYGFERNEEKLLRLFSAFNFNNSGFLTFSEFLIGLVSIEPMAINGQSRIKFIFKYYNQAKNGFLTNTEFEDMVREIHPKESEQQIKKRVEGSMKRIGVKKDGIAFEDFFKACGTHAFRGTSCLCRSNRVIITQIRASISARTLARSVLTSKDSPKSKAFINLLGVYQYKGSCLSCKERCVDYAIHTVMINTEGRCVDPLLLPDWHTFDRKVKSSETSKGSVTSDESVKSVANSNTSLSVLNISYEQFSKNFVFNPKFAANFLIEKIRAFNKIKGSYKDGKGVMDSLPDRQEFFLNVEQLCKEVERILNSEERCLQISSPAFVIGDIHGNLEDLLTMERVLWKSLPIVSANYLFLGDYVDRGVWSVECAVYILCMKLLAPNKVFILRGNHEVRDLQLHYTYKEECIRKYGDNYGKKIFELTNRVFDRLPFCAVIDDAIFCAHGGIPCSTRSISKINEVPVDLPNPEAQSSIAWEILWSDPIEAQEYSRTAALLEVRVESARGFLSNAKRGTAFLFSEEAVNNFFNTNGLTHIIRAHEVPAHGFEFHFGNKCLTIFSHSHYCGTKNEAACVHVDQQKLRIVRLDTVNNAPACGAK